MKLRVVIADDEALARERLQQFLRLEPAIEVVAECRNGLEVVLAIRQRTPDLVFLDVKMPELDGFGVLEALKETPLPAIIFVTAYDRFAVKAFEANVVDYLLKPFDRERFQTALRRARERLQRGLATQDHSGLVDVLAKFQKRSGRLERVTIKSQGRISLVNTVDIDWICAADNYAELHVGKRSHLLRMTITALAEELPPNQFVRISRSHLVNLGPI